MRIILKGLAGLLVLLFFVGASYSLYSKFLVDYSLENLETALGGTEQDPNLQNITDRYAYRTVLQGLVLEESSHSDVNYQELTFLELALRSFDEATERGGYARAKIYLDQVRQTKLSQRNPLLQMLDNAYRQLDKVMEYLNKKWKKGKTKMSKTTYRLDEAYEFSGMTKLNDARMKEMNGDFQGAERLYKEYLNLDPKRSDRGVVSISLSHALIQQKKYSEAEDILNEVMRVFDGMRESRMAASILRQIEGLKKKQQEIRVAAVKSDVVNESIRFKLALDYLASYQREDALKIFKALVDAAQPDIQNRSQFYLSMLLKQTGQLEESTAIIRRLLQEGNIEKDMDLAAKVQLADIYHKKNEVRKALGVYDEILFNAYEDVDAEEQARNAWVALAELEKASVYIFDMKDYEKGQESLEKLGQIAPSLDNLVVDVMNTAFMDPMASIDQIREMGFSALQQGSVRDSQRYFLRVLEMQPNDAWTMAALASVYTLSGQMEESVHMAEKAFSVSRDDYTSSMLGYVYTLSNQFDDAVRLYKLSQEKNPQYLPASFNLGYTYLMANRADDALETYKKLYRELPKGNKFLHAKTLNNIGCALYALGRYPEAENMFSSALEIQPTFDLAKKNLGMAQRRIRSNESVRQKMA